MSPLPEASATHRDPGSFRDPSGYVFVGERQAWRTVNAPAAAKFRQVQATGLIAELVKRGLLIGTDVADITGAQLDAFRGARGELPEFVLAHPRLPFISYPYEWTFSQLKAAALAHLDLQVIALDHDVALSDSTPYNMQFDGGRAKLIDVLSLRPYVPGEIWAGYNQFCRQFLLPLLLEAWSGVPFQPMLRGRVDGITLAEGERLLPWSKRWLGLQGLMHVTLPARMERSQSSARQGDDVRVPTLAKSRYRALLTEMRAWVGGLGSRRSARTFWNTYATVNSYSGTMQDAKREFVSAAIRASGAATVWDLGGNTGEYSVAALAAGAQRAIVFDSDLDSLEKAYAASQQGHPGLLPVVMDCADPSPSLGWRQAERKGLGERANADAVLALALVHHLAIGRNIPLRSVIEWIVGLGAGGVIEFVPKSDPMVVQMLAHREDVFHDYDEAHFRQWLGAVAEPLQEHRFAENGRLIVAFKRRP
jgi:ribosomal protein L11 methylase PrmA